MSKILQFRDKNIDDKIKQLKDEIACADAVVIGAGAGMSSAAGFIYTGERFDKYFFDYSKKYGFVDMYTGGFYPFEKTEIFWAYWARYIYINRYMDPPKDTYQKLFDIIRAKDYFVITTNVDHCFQKAGFDKKRLFYTQGDYGLFQSVNPAIRRTFDNKQWVMEAMEAQGFVKNSSGIFTVPSDHSITMSIPSELIPKCPIDGSPMTTNLRADNKFVEDEGWHRAANAYTEFLRNHNEQHVLFLELGVGSNTPGIIKYPFWDMTAENKKAVYGCINFGEAYCPKEIENQSICIDGDIDEVIDMLK